MVQFTLAGVFNPSFLTIPDAGHEISCELRVTSCELKVASCGLRVNDKDSGGESHSRRR